MDSLSCDSESRSSIKQSATLFLMVLNILPLTDKLGLFPEAIPTQISYVQKKSSYPVRKQGQNLSLRGLTIVIPLRSLYTTWKFT